MMYVGLVSACKEVIIRQTVDLLGVLNFDYKRFLYLNRSSLGLLE